MPVNRAKKISAAKAYAATPSAVAVALAYSTSAHGHVDVGIPNSIANRHAAEFSEADPQSAAMQAEKVAVRFVLNCCNCVVNNRCAGP